MANKNKYFKDVKISLSRIIELFNSPIKEEHAWALCYQCVNFYSEILRQHKVRKKCFNVTKIEHIWLNLDGSINPLTAFVVGLGLVIFDALDLGYECGEERSMSKDLEHLIDSMTSVNEKDFNETYHETEDDEGIERDSSECDDLDHQISSSSQQNSQHHMLLKDVIEYCSRYISPNMQQQQIIDNHYKAVSRAFVAEAIELITFLEKVSTHGANDLKKDSSDLSKLKFTDWARFWVQVMSELRMGVKLKKVHRTNTRTPIEFELTPYEILMDDIRSRRYKLRKIMVDGDIPHQVKQNAHAVILEFIRSRPPLKKVSDRKLPPPKKHELTPREQLMVSIKNGRRLRPILCKAKLEIVISNCTNNNNNNNNLGPDSQGEVSSSMKKNQSPECRSSKRRIKVDLRALEQNDDDDDYEDNDEDEHNSLSQKYTTNQTILANRPMIKDYRTQCTSHEEEHRFCDTTVECIKNSGISSVSHSRPQSRQSRNSDESEVVASALTAVTPDLSWSRSSLQEELLQSKNWEEAMSLDDRLSLTLDEIVHIRSVLTKAELEAMPFDSQIKDDVEKRKVCFLCLKTRFSLFGQWGQKCRLCQRTVCTKCFTKMHIPNKRFFNVPVVLLSPNLLSTLNEHKLQTSSPLLERLRTLNSAPNSPKSQRSVSSSSVTQNNPHLYNSMLSLNENRQSTSTTKRKLQDHQQIGNSSVVGIEIIVCQDCKTMVIQIIESSRMNRTAVRNNIIRNLTLKLSPVYKT